MASNLERRLGTLESQRNDKRKMWEMTDAELLALLGWKGAVPPTDEELLAFKKGEKRGSHVHAD